MTEATRDPIERAAKAAAALAPVLGVLAPTAGAQVAAAIVETLSAFTGAGRMAEVARQQVESFLENIRHELARLLPATPEQFIQSQSMVQLLMLAVRAVVTETQADKRRAYARIIVRGATPEWKGQLDKLEHALRALIEAGPRDFAVIKAAIPMIRQTTITRQPPGIEGFTLFPDDLGAALCLGRDEANAYLHRLQAFGLVTARSTGQYEKAATDFAVTPLFYDLIKLLED